MGLHERYHIQTICLHCPTWEKEPNWTRLVIDGDCLNYPDEVTTPTADMLVAKILFNSVISTASACFMMMDISNFYLNTLLKCPEFICMCINDTPVEIIREYDLCYLLKPDGCIYIRLLYTKGALCILVVSWYPAGQTVDSNKLILSKLKKKNVGLNEVTLL